MNIIEAISKLENLKNKISAIYTPSALSFYPATIADVTLNKTITILTNQLTVLINKSQKDDKLNEADTNQIISQLNNIHLSDFDKYHKNIFNDILTLKAAFIVYRDHELPLLQKLTHTRPNFSV